MIIETCPRCGADLKKYIISTSPPMEAIKCDGCGWHREGAYVFDGRDGWSGRERIVRVPFDPEQRSVRVYTDDQYIARDAAREKLCSMCRYEGTDNCDECEHPIDDIPSVATASFENRVKSRDGREITNADRIQRDDGRWDNENDYGFDGWGEKDDDSWDNENDYGSDGWGK